MSAGQDPGLALGLERQGELVTAGAVLSAGMSGAAALDLSWKRKDAEAGIRLHSAGWPELHLSLKSRVDEHTKLSFGWRLTMDGLHWDLGYKRAHQSVAVPVHLTTTWEPKLLFAAVTVPFVTALAFNKLYLGPKRAAKRRA